MSGVGFVYWNTYGSIFFSFWRNSWNSLLLLFIPSKRRRQNASLRSVLSTAVRKSSRLSNPFFTVLKPNVCFKQVFKPLSLNPVSYSLCISFLIDSFWLPQNYFHKNTFLNLLIEIIRSYWTDFQDVSGTNRSKVPMHTRWNYLRRLSILKAQARPRDIKVQLWLIHN